MKRNGTSPPLPRRNYFHEILLLQLKHDRADFALVHVRNRSSDRRRSCKIAREDRSESNYSARDGADTPPSYRCTCNKAVSLRERLNDGRATRRAGIREAACIGSRKVVKVNERNAGNVGGEPSGERNWRTLAPSLRERYMTTSLDGRSFLFGERSSLVEFLHPNDNMYRTYVCMGRVVSSTAVGAGKRGKIRGTWVDSLLRAADKRSHLT